MTEDKNPIVGWGCQEGEQCGIISGCENKPTCYVDVDFEMVPCCNIHARGRRDRIAEIFSKIFEKK